MFVVVMAVDNPGMHDIRARTKARHRSHLDQGAPGLRVLQSGPLLNPDGKERGSLLIVEADDVNTVRAFVEADPYVENRLFASVEICPWKWRRGNPHLADTGEQPSPA